MDIAKITFKDGREYYIDNNKIDDDTWYKIRSLVRRIPDEDIYEPSNPEYLAKVREHQPQSLKGCANALVWLTEAGGIRQYFDENMVYDSPTLFNFFSMIEEVAYDIEKGKYKDAEEYVKRFKF